MRAEFRLGDWRVEPVKRRITRADDPKRTVQIDPKGMEVLLVLAERAGGVVTKEEIIASVWGGAFVTDEVITTAIWGLRKSLGDDARDPRYIQTIPRVGYRLIAEAIERDVPKPTSASPARVWTAALVAIAIAAWAVWSFRPRRVELTSPAVVAVLPFEVRGGEEFSYLSDGMADLLAATLDTESQRTVDPTTLLRVVERMEGEVIDPDRAREVAAHFGAGRFVLGSVVESSGGLRIQAALFDASAGGDVLARASVEGAGEDLFTLVDRLTARLLVAQQPDSENYFVRSATATTESLEALKAYLEGEKVLRTPFDSGTMSFGGAGQRAVPHFRRAVELDPSFALAWYRLARAARFGWSPDPAREYLQEALRYADRLSERDRLRVEATVPYVEARFEDASTRYEALLRKYPDDATAWEDLGEVRLYSDWRSGVFYEDSLKRQVECFERAWALDDRDLLTNALLYYLYMQQGRLEEAERPARIFVGEDAPLPTTVRTRRALENDDLRAWERLLDEIARQRAIRIRMIFDDVAVLPEHSTRAREVARLLLDAQTRSPVEQASGHVFMAILATSRGRWEEAKKELAAAAPLYPAAAVTFEAILALAPFLEVRHEEIRSIRDRLRAWTPRLEPPLEGNTFPFPQDLHAVLQPYLLGLLSVRLGDRSSALRYAHELDQVPGPKFAPALAQDFGRSVRAHVAVAMGRTEDALALLEQARMDAHPQHDHSLGYRFAIQVPERFLRAELLYRQGRGEEALGWWPVDGQTWTFAFAHLRIGQVRERQGRTKEAIAHLSRFIKFWEDCDPRLEPLVEDARLRVERLRRQEMS